MSSGQPLFQLRKELSVPLSVGEDDTANQTADSSTSYGRFQSVDVSLDTHHHEDQQTFNNIKILTENERYAVKRLAPDLSTLPIDSSSSEGLVDTHSGKALVNDNDFLYIWDYYSSQRNTNFCRIPLHEEHVVLKHEPKCLITWPAAMDDTTQMFAESSGSAFGGVCIIHRKNGQLIYYEDIDSINNLHLQLSHSKAHTVSLKLKENESVTQAINCEPAGIVIATSLGRVVFVTIRDSSGKPSVRVKQQLVKPQQGFFFSTFNPSNEIVSMKMGPIVGRGERLLYIATRGGNFQMWHLSVSISSYKRLDVQLSEQILDSLQDLYPFARGSLQVLNSHPLFPDSSSVHLVLSSISNGYEMYYILSTILLDEKTKSFTIFSTYRLNTYVKSFVDKKPEFFIPAAVGEQLTDTTTVFVLFEDAVVLTQVSSKLDSSYPLRRKWEDIISFRDDVNLIGSGYDSDSIYVMSKEIGVLEISVTGEVNESERSMEEVRFVKSHVDQAVYFSGISSNPIEFNLPEGISLEADEIEADLRSCSDEIFHSKGKYIPPMMNTLTQHLSLRVDLFGNLLNFVEQNFNFKVSPNEKLMLLQNFEILNCSLKLCILFKNLPELSEIWKKTLKLRNSNLTSETLFVSHLHDFPKVFSQFLVQLNNKSMPASISLKASVVDLLIECVYEGILEDGEKKIRYDLFKLDPLELSIELSWFINYENLESINSSFLDFKFSTQITSDEDKNRLLTLTKTLYYLFNQANLWFKEYPQRQETELFNRFQLLFLNNHLSWNQALLDSDLKQEALQIAEFYQDLEALVETLESLDRSISQEAYFYYFDKFGYQFASTVFQYYINQNKLDDLFYRFPEQHDMLVEFLGSSNKYGEVAWIQEILDRRYDAASSTLCDISLGETKVGQPLEQRQIYLNIAKLTGLMNKPVPLDQLKLVQSDLDTLDGQKNLLFKLQDPRIKLASRFVGTPFEKLFQSLTGKIEQHQGLNLRLLIEFYSMLEDTDSFYCALKLIAFNGDLLGYEHKKFLVAMVWRRCILRDDWDSVKDDTKSSLYQVLCKYFGEEFFQSNLALPSFASITDSSLLTMEYLQNVYQENGGTIYDSFHKEFESAGSLGPGFDKRIQSIIATANEATGKKCIVNYETNTVEYYS
ncbi:hypothetical protein ZYGR_0AF04060 [Zygosaccharomyces rouxii]|uniref:Nucleoporin Nup133/Nup155-like N-terminal domain-containing protein n=1 Tax=Zygosaccharomyces rouxii TaxID=4956 RepID=A0A1Q3A882_ZYGRO|nr:hypothetical protein ZYGR_0AF04060 [Zygosaccharomyces rouxii]